jgi:hypothetical protein
MIEIWNRHTGAKSSKLAESQGEAMLWIAQQHEADPDNPNAYRLRNEPTQIYKSTADLPMQKGRYDDWD